MAEKDKADDILELMKKPEKIRNIGIVAHIDHGKTTMTDSLLAGAGMISEELAGKMLVMDFHSDEKERGITIDSASVNMVHPVEDDKYLINLIDTPGHVDFGGDVTRAMRACDGAVVVACAVEGMMPQTETVLKQALRERVKPVLFINKADRLIRELKLTPEKMQERFKKIIDDVNKYIVSIAPDEYKNKWQVSVKDGSVAFGSAIHKWALSFPYMEKNKMSFADVLKMYEDGSDKELIEKAPLHKIILNMVVNHLPNPLESQKYRIPKIWSGDLESEGGKALMGCDANGPVVFVVTKIVIDEHAGEVAGGRLFSGTVSKGQSVFLNQAKAETKIQQVNLYKGAQRIVVDDVPAGNILGVSGLKGVFSGETVSSKEIEPFESLKHIFEPVVTESIEAKKASDLPKLVDILKKVAKEDPTVKVEINEETGEHLLSGMGELHLEVIVNRIKTEKGLEVDASPPIVVYRETVGKISGEFPGRSPNKHNTFFISVEPLEDNIYDAIMNGELPEGKVRKKDDKVREKLLELGLDGKTSKQFKEIYKGCVFMDKTRGVVQIGEVIELCMEAFRQIIDSSPLAGEPALKLKVGLTDAKLHEDSIHRGPAQVLPAVRDAIRAAIADGESVLFEPLQVLQIESETKYMGNITSVIQNKRGQMLNVEQDGDHLAVRAKMPVAETFGLASELRSATEGKATFFIVDQLFQRVPKVIQVQVVKRIRERKGLDVEEESE